MTLSVSGNSIFVPTYPREDLFNRNIVLQINTTQITARSLTNLDKSRPTLRIVFKIEKNLAEQPNKSTVAVYNLSEVTRKFLSVGHLVRVQAGYTKTLTDIFSGTVSYINQGREGADWISTFHCADSLAQYTSARMNKSYTTGTPIKRLLMDAVATMGVGLGNSIEAIAGPSMRKGFTTFLKGAVASGKVSDILTKYLGSTGYNWSIQDGQLQVIGKGLPTREPAIVLSSTSGLIGSPELGEKGLVKAKSLLQGGFHAGRMVSIISRGINGIFVTEKVVHSGDTWGADWTTDIDARPL